MISAILVDDEPLANEAMRGLLTAWPAVFLPAAWMASIHQQIGLGDMPEAPIVECAACGGLWLSEERFDAFCASRLAATPDVFGLLPASLPLQALVDRAMPAPAA